MRIGLVYHGAYPWERGLEQFASLLLALGHSPVVIASRPGFAGATDDRFPVVHVTGDESPRRGNPFRAGALDWRWARWIEQAAAEHGLEALIARETVIAPWTLLAGRRAELPVFLDMRENLAEMYRTGSARNPLLKLLRHERVVGAVESRLMGRFEHVFTVSPELRDWLLRRYDIAPGKTSVLENTPGEMFLEGARAAVSAPRPPSPPTLVFAGHIKENRGVQDVLRALPTAAAAIPDLRFRIIGSGSYQDVLKELCAELEIEPLVEFVPLLPASEVPAALAEADVGILSYHLNPQTHQTVPGKLFEYMAVGLPVLSSARRPVVRIVEETGCGTIYHSSSPPAIADEIVRLLEDRERARAIGERGRGAVENRYNWRSNLATVRAVFGGTESGTS